MVWTVKTIVELMDRLAPPSLAMDWDAVGLQIGSMDSPVERVFVTLDLTENSLSEAMSHDPQMIVTHHPFLFNPLKQILTDQPQGRMIQQLLKANTALFAAHTNMDITWGGLNDWAAEKLILQGVTHLELTSTQSLVKLAAFVPEGSVERVADALAKAGAGHIGRYSHCSFRTLGTGTFKPLEGAKPAIGQLNRLESVEEVRLETLLPLGNQDQAIQAMLEAHPYEEVAYDLIRLEQPGAINGIGRRGKLPAAASPEAFIRQLKSLFQLSSLRWVRGASPTIRHVGVLAGSGASAIKAAALSGCDALVTGDVKYHDAQEAESLGIHLFDVGHFESETCFVEIVTNHLKQHVEAAASASVQIIPSTEQKSPIHVV